MKKLSSHSLFCQLSYWGFLFLLLGTSGCSSLFKSTPTPEETMTVISVTEKYIQVVVTGRKRQIRSFVLWDDLLSKDTEDAITLKEFESQLNSLQDRWTPEQHPLLGLKLLELDIDDNDALVRLQKSGREDYPVIWIKLFWSGNAWLVTQDSLFGKDKLISQLNSGKVTIPK